MSSTAKSLPFLTNDTCQWGPLPSATQTLGLLWTVFCFSFFSVLFFYLPLFTEQRVWCRTHFLWARRLAFKLSSSAYQLLDLGQSFKISESQSHSTQNEESNFQHCSIISPILLYVTSWFNCSGLLLCVYSCVCVCVCVGLCLME